jgi:hypothetical protein
MSSRRTALTFITVQKQLCGYYYYYRLSEDRVPVIVVHDDPRLDMDPVLKAASLPAPKLEPPTSSVTSSTRIFKWAVFGFIASSVGYWFLRNYRLQS